MTLHADHIGSLLRPPELLDARAAHDRGDLSDDAALRARLHHGEPVVSVADEVWGS
jgi:methionine synthase II (cobalamin-independent)